MTRERESTRNDVEKYVYRQQSALSHVCNVYYAEDFLQLYNKLADW